MGMTRANAGKRLCDSCRTGSVGFVLPLFLVAFVYSD